MEELVKKLTTGARYPYGSPEQVHFRKKQYPARNLHYVHHDSVLPTKAAVQQFDQFQRRKLGVENEANPHFVSEYRKRFELGDKKYDAIRKYLVPGEYAGKSTYNGGALTNGASSPDSVSSVRDGFNHSSEEISTQKSKIYSRNSDQPDSFFQNRKAESFPLDLNKQPPPKEEDFDEYQLPSGVPVMRGLQMRKRMREPELKQGIQNPELVTQEVEVEKEQFIKLKDEGFQFENDDQKVRRVERPDPFKSYQDEEFRLPNISNQSTILTKNGLQSIPNANNGRYQNKNLLNKSYEIAPRFVNHSQLISKYDIQSSDPRQVPDEQVRYYQRLKNSIERQNNNYQHHLSQFYNPLNQSRLQGTKHSYSPLKNNGSDQQSSNTFRNLNLKDMLRKSMLENQNWHSQSQEKIIDMRRENVGGSSLIFKQNTRNNY